jgi:hypothetical protein
MMERPDRPGRIDRLLTGQHITVGGRTIQPVARLNGQFGGGLQAEGGGFGAWVRMTPVEVIVREADGAEQRIATPNATQQALRGIVSAGLAVASVCLASMLIVSLIRLSRRPQ